MVFLLLLCSPGKRGAELLYQQSQGTWSVLLLLQSSPDFGLPLTNNVREERSRRPRGGCQLVLYLPASPFTVLWLGGVLSRKARLANYGGDTDTWKPLANRLLGSSWLKTIFSSRFISKYLKNKNLPATFYSLKKPLLCLLPNVSKRTLSRRCEVQI